MAVKTLSTEEAANYAMAEALSYLGVSIRIDISQIPGYRINNLIDALTAYRNLKVAELKSYYNKPKQ